MGCLQLTYTPELKIAHRKVEAIHSHKAKYAQWFTSIDPVTHFSQSTYNAFDSNPVSIADPSGADGVVYGMAGQSVNSNFHNRGHSSFGNANYGNNMPGAYNEGVGAAWGDGGLLATAAGTANLNINLNWGELDLNTFINFGKNSINVSSDNLVGLPGVVLPSITLKFGDKRNGELVQQHLYRNSPYHHLGSDFSLAAMYGHFQIGGGKPMNIRMSSVDFSGTNQRDLGLTGMIVGKSRPVNLFNAGPTNEAALAFGRVNMMYHGNNQFSILSDKSARFDFNPIIDSKASLGRNAGNVLGAAINYNLIISPVFSVVPLIFGGGYPVNFIGTTYIHK